MRFSMKYAAICLTLMLSLTFLLVIDAKASEKTIFVPGDFGDIQVAINNANEGDTVLVKSGIYSNLELTINKSLSLIGEDVKTTILKGQKPTIQSQTGALKDNQTNSAQTLTQPIAENNNTPQATFCNFVPPYPQTSKAIVINAPNVIVSNLTILDADVCIEVNSFKTQIVGNRLAGNDYAVYLSGSINNITKNIIMGNKAVFSAGISNAIIRNFINCSLGIELYANSNVISENVLQAFNPITMQAAYGYIGGSHTISENTMISDGRGECLSLFSSCPNNKIFANNITGYNKGILLGDSSDNTIRANCVTDCTYAIWLYGAPTLSPSLEHSPKNNTFYHNNFIKNTNQIGTQNENFLETSESTKNFWDNGKEGNYWDDYKSTDTNRDGIGDIPYLIDAKRQDNFPLMMPYGGIHNIISQPSTLPPTQPSSTPSSTFQYSSPSPAPQSTTSPKVQSLFPAELIYVLVAVVLVAITSVTMILKKRK